MCLCVCVLVSGCSHLNINPLSDDEIETQFEYSKKHYVTELAQDIAVFENVAIGLGLPLRKYLEEDRSIEQVFFRSLR